MGGPVEADAPAPLAEEARNDGQAARPALAVVHCFIPHVLQEV